MFGALKRGRFRSLASLILVVNVVSVGELQRKRTLAASRGFLAAARLSCCIHRLFIATYATSKNTTEEATKTLGCESPSHRWPLLDLLAVLTFCLARTIFGD